MNPVLAELYRQKEVTGPSGRKFSTHVGISKEDTGFLTRIIRGDPTIKKTLEVGCALGFSSLAICEATKDRPGAHHTIIDPGQLGGWEEMGISHLKKAGFTNFDLIPDGSEYAMPTLAKEAPGTFDLVFIDGCHTFDHTVVDQFFADLLVRDGGYIIIDDTRSPSVSAATYQHLVGNPRYSFFSRHEGQRNVAKRRLAGAVSPLARSRAALGILPGKVGEKLRALQLGDMAAFKKVPAA